MNVRKRSSRQLKWAFGDVHIESIIEIGWETRKIENSSNCAGMVCTTSDDRINTKTSEAVDIKE